MKRYTATGNPRSPWQGLVGSVKNGNSEDHKSRVMSRAARNLLLEKTTEYIGGDHHHRCGKGGGTQAQRGTLNTE